MVANDHPERKVRSFKSSLVLVALTAFAAGNADLCAAKDVAGLRTPLDLIKEKMAKIGEDPRPSEIILGNPAKPDSYPFLVSLIAAGVKKGEEFNGHFCGGSIVDDHWVLTAGHCVTQNDQVTDPLEIQVYVGSHNFRRGDRIPVKSVHRHPDYAPDFTENDVALLELARGPRKVKYSTVGLATLANEEEFARPGGQVTIAGWGTTEGGEQSQNLREATVKMVARPECSQNILEKRLAQLKGDLSLIARSFRLAPESLDEIRNAIVKSAGSIVTENMLCAGDPTATIEPAKDTCQGDSGGPLIANGPEGKKLQVGIVSWGEGCGVPKLYGVYTRVSTFADWVKSIIDRRPEGSRQ